jgi:hypothetical protein
VAEGQGCRLCNEGYTWVSPYAQGRDEQGDDFIGLPSRVMPAEFIWGSPDCQNVKSFERWNGGRR